MAKAPAVIPIEEVTVSEAAAMASVDTKTIRRWIGAGHITARQLPGGGTMPYLVSKPSLLAYLETRGDQPVR